MKTLGERIKEFRNKMGINQKEFAEMCGKIDTREGAWGQSRIGNYEINAREPSLEDIGIIAKVLGITPADLAFGNAKFVQIHKSFHYPLLSKIQARRFTEISTFSHIDDTCQYEMIASQIHASSNAFYLEIDGDSMLPRFKAGDMVLIDPAILPKPGEFVAALNENGEATFKQYKETGEIDEHGRPHFNLVPLNDNYGTLSSKQHNITLIGKAVEHRQMLG